MNFSVLILLIAIILFGVLAFRQMSALILAPVVTIFVIVLSGMPFWTPCCSTSCPLHRIISRSIF